MFLKQILQRVPEARLAFVGDGPQRAELESEFAGLPVVFMVSPQRLCQTRHFMGRTHAGRARWAFLAASCPAQQCMHFMHFALWTYVPATDACFFYCVFCCTGYDAW